MTSRIRRDVAVLAAVAMLALGVAACDNAVSGEPTAGDNPNLFVAKEAFGAAVSEMEARPLMRYTSTVVGADSERVAVTVSRTGATYGTSTVDGNRITLAVLDDKLYVQASSKYWRELGAKPNEVKKFAKEMVLADPSDIGFDPARTLTPKQVATELRSAMAQESTPSTTATPSTSAPSTAPSGPAGPSTSAKPERKVERLKLDDGTDVYRIPVGEHSVDVTVAQPYRIVGTDVPLAATGVDPLVPDGSRITFGAGDEQDLRDMYGELAKVAKGAKGTSVMVPNFQLQQGVGKLDCQIGGKCTAKVRVDNTYSRQDQLPVSRFDVQMKAKMTATGLGSRTCDDTAVMRPNKGVSMACTADFALAPSYTPRSYPVRATWTVAAIAKYIPDTKELSADLKDELNDLLDEI